MTKTYLKSYNIPKTWEGISRKEKTYTLRPNPGPYKKEFVIPLGTALKLLGLARTTKEAKYILQNKKTLVNSKKTTEIKHPLGLTDVLAIEGLRYRVELSEKGKLKFTPSVKDYKLKPAKIIGKTILKKGKTQLNLNDGRNLIVKNGKYKVGDTLILELPEQKIKEVIELKKGANILLIKGKHIGEKGIVKELKGKKIIYTNKENKEIETPKSYVLALPKTLQ